MIENNETEKTEETKKHEKSSRPETNGTAAKPERETCSAQVPVSFVEQVKARVNSGGFFFFGILEWSKMAFKGA